MMFTTVYRKEGVYAGWPANHGAWQWGDEFLVGFMIGAYDDDFGNGAGHMIKAPYSKLLARSWDGGETWDTEHPNRKFDAKYADRPPRLDLNKADTIVRVCGRYDTGGEDCTKMGGFYISEDRGHDWRGPYAFSGLLPVLGGENHCTARTRHNFSHLFLSAAKENQWGTDWVFVAHHDGKNFIFNPERDIVLRDHYRAVMPSITYSGPYTLCALRRKGRGHNWIDIVRKKHGEDGWSGPWQLMAQPDELKGIADTGAFNGNPPALRSFYIRKEKDHIYRSICCYANRSARALCAVYSDDHGSTWSEPVVLEQGDNSDIGYPQLFQRSDGLAVCVYYWVAGEASAENPQHIRACIFDPKTLG